MRFLAILTVLLAFVGAKAENIELSMQNSLVIRGPIDEGSVLKAQKDLLKLDSSRGDKDYPIYIVLDSPGGSISDGEDFIQLAKTIKNVKTVTIFAASMASAIVQALPGERLVTEHAIMMFHRAKGGFGGQFETGEVESRLRMAKQLVLRLENRNAARLKYPLKEYKQRVVNELWMVGKESVEQRAADKVIDITCTKELLETQEELNVSSLFGSFTVIFNKCPLIRGAELKQGGDQQKFLEYKRELDKQYGKMDVKL